MLRLRVFGGLRLERDGAVLDGAAAQRRPLALLAILAVAGETGVSRDRLCGLLWPESDEERARGSLKQSLYSLRRDAGTADLVLGSSDLRLNPEVIGSDVDDFRRALAAGDLESAASNYAGPLLEGLHLRDADDFERWSDEVRRNLAAQYAAALEQLSTKARERGDNHAAVAWARQWSIAEPLSERATISYMTALIEVGDRATAVKQGELHRAMVRAELDVEPGPRLLQLLAQLRDPSSHTESVGKTIPVSTAKAGNAATEVPERVVEKLEADAPFDPVAMETAARPSTARSQGRRPSVMFAAGVALAGIVWIGNRTLPAEPQRPSVALAPFSVDPADTSMIPFTRDLKAAVAAQIVGMGRVTMLPATDSATARDAGVAHLVDAVVESVRDSVVVRASIRRAIDGRAEVVLDAVSAPRADAREILRIVSDRIGGAVAALSDTLYRAWSLAGSRTPSFAAYQAFALAIESIAHQPPYQSVQPIVDLLATASRLDSTFAAARVLLIEQSDYGQLRAFSDSVQAVAVARRHTLGAYDVAALDNIVAIRAGDWDAALTAARRMVSIAPTLADAHFAVARAQMATRRYRGALASLDTIARLPSWLSPRRELWQWDLAALHALGEYETGVEHFGQVFARNPDEYSVCLWGLPDLIALGREAAVDSLVARCASTVGRGSSTAPTKIPNRAYFDIVIPQYRAHGNDLAAIRAAARIRPAFQKYATEPAKARDLATIDCMLGNWAACYPPLVKWTHKAAEFDDYGNRRLGVAAAHMADTTAMRSALRATDSAAGCLDRGHALLSRAMIHAAAGQRDSAIYLLGRAKDAGMAPTAVEWVARPAAVGTCSDWETDWYHAYELLPLRDDPVFKGLLKPKEE